MHGKEHIIELGKLLRAEHERGYDDGATTSGLEEFLADWRARANGALSYPEVQNTLALLNGYADFDDLNRRTRVDTALERLRMLVRQGAGSGKREAESGGYEAAAKSLEPETPEEPTPNVRVVASNSAPVKAKPKAQKAAPKPKTPKPIQPLTLESTLDSVMTPKNTQSFRRLGVNTVLDLLFHFPHRYEDLSSRKQIADLVIGETSTVVGDVSDVRTFHTKSGRGSVEVRLSDDTGVIKLTFFGQPWLSKQLPVGKTISVSGKVDSYMGMRQMNGPNWEAYNHADDALLHTGRMVPVHSLTKGLIESNARAVIKTVVDRAAPLLIDYLPERVRQRAALMSLREAITQIHFPDNQEQRDKARLRLGFDEFLLIQLGVLQRKLLWQGEPGYAMPFNAAVHQDFLSKLAFKLTGAQTRALDEIFEDLRRPVPMARLLQGDVGSGKTAVAAAAAMQAIASGFQVALMAPTEILAEQHYKGLRALLSQVAKGQGAEVSEHAAGQAVDPQSKLAEEERLRLDEIKRLLGMTVEDDLDGQGVRVALLTGSLGAKERRRVLEAIANGDVDLIIGTHALITESVRYAQLGLVIVDEQHRFGVEQRQRLKGKGFNPHMLVMTATPIPRTLTLTIYGDLDTTILDELPPGRQEIRTRWVTTAEREKAYRHMRREINQGRQAFVICPLVDESEKVDLPSAEEMYDKLSSEVFPEYRVALLHGKMLPRDKDQIMIAFRNHEFDILVATAVIEVGIDVPNATTIAIEGAERFGLAQLHQFRGRVGRGAHQSYCILISDKDNEVTTQRLGAMENTTDGFKLAEIDLELRGPGEFFGKRQSGTPDLKVAQLADTKLLHAANREARQILGDDPQLADAEHAALKAKVDAFWTDVIKAG